MYLPLKRHRVNWIFYRQKLAISKKWFYKFSFLCYNMKKYIISFVFIVYLFHVVKIAKWKG